MSEECQDRLVKIITEDSIDDAASYWETDLQILDETRTRLEELRSDLIDAQEALKIEVELLAELSKEGWGSLIEKTRKLLKKRRENRKRPHYIGLDRL